MNPNGTANVSLESVDLGSDEHSLVLQPDRTSRTYRNLKERPEGIFHVTDDVLLVARAAVERTFVSEDFVPAQTVRSPRLQNTCRWYEFRIEWWDERRERPRAKAAVVHVGNVRNFCGFNRAKCAVVEAALLLKKLTVLSEETVKELFAGFKLQVQKAGGEQEAAALELIETHVQKMLARMRRRSS